MSRFSSHFVNYLQSDAATVMMFYAYPVINFSKQSIPTARWMLKYAKFFALSQFS